MAGALAVGAGLAAAPFAFSMFSRAPGGGHMIDGFAPYMAPARVERFVAHLDEISAATAEAAGATAAGAHGAVGELVRQWPAIDADMRSMLADVGANVDNYRAVAALPPFALFPWFFVAPGVAVVGLAAWALRRGSRRAEIGLIVVGLAIVAAPAVFQMFSRAPAGAVMIDDFRPLMTPARVTTIQGYFLTIGAAEGELRNEVLPQRPAGLAAVRRFSQDWPAISADMAPMIGAMSDNLANFAGVAALPPFWLFPWFFVVPGALVAGLGSLSLVSARLPEAPPSRRALERSVA